MLVTAQDLPNLANADGSIRWDAETFDAVLERAKTEGYDSVNFKSVADIGEPADQIVVFDPKNVRSVNAAFDPEEGESPLIMASLRGLPHPMQLGDPRRSGLEPPERGLSDLVSAVTDALGLTVRHGRLSPGLKARAGRLGMAVAGQFSR